MTVLIPHEKQQGREKMTRQHWHSARTRTALRRGHAQCNSSATARSTLQSMHARCRPLPAARPPHTPSPARPPEDPSCSILCSMQLPRDLRDECTTGAVSDVSAWVRLELRRTSMDTHVDTINPAVRELNADACAQHCTRHSCAVQRRARRHLRTAGRSPGDDRGGYGDFQMLNSRRIDSTTALHMCCGVPKRPGS